MLSETEIQNQLIPKIKSLIEPLELIDIKKQQKIKNEFILDLVVKTKYKKKEKKLIIEIKSLGEPRHIERAIAQVKFYSKKIPNSYPIVASYYISEKSRQICKELEVGYIDLFGNIFIELPYILIDKESKKTKNVEKKKQKYLFSPVSTRIIRTLLLNPEGKWTIKSLSQQSESSLGYTHRVVEKLLDEQYILRDNNYKIKLKESSGLLDKWRDSYSFQKNKIYPFYTFDKNKESIFKNLAEVTKSNNLEYALTLHSGAYFIAPYVRFTDIHFYIRSDLNIWTEKLDLRPVESGANIYLIEPYDKGVFQGLQRIDEKLIVSNIQLYLDLYNYPKRGREQADFLREKKINF